MEGSKPVPALRAAGHPSVVAHTLVEPEILQRFFSGLLFRPRGDDEQDPLARFDAGFVLLSGTLRALLRDLQRLLGGYAKT